MFDLKSKAREVIERGYCVLESVYDNREREQMCAIFKQLCDEKDGFSSEQPSISFHPLLEWGPKMAPFFAKAVVVDAMAEVFQDDVRLAHSGAAVFNNALVGETLTHWHVHYAWEVPPTGLQRENPERGALQYLRGRIRFPHWSANCATAWAQRFGRSKRRC